MPKASRSANGTLHAKKIATCGLHDMNFIWVRMFH